MRIRTSNVVIAILLLGVLTSSLHAKASYGDVVETTLEYGIQAGDILIYQMNLTSSEYDMEGEAEETSFNYMKYVIQNASVSGDGLEANLTYDAYQWNNIHEFNIPEMNESAYWYSDLGIQQITNKSYYTMLYEGVFAIAKDISLEYLVANRTVEYFIYEMFSFESIEEFETNMYDSFADEADIEDEQILQFDMDAPYGRIIYSYEIMGENLTTDTAMDYRLHFEFNIKYNAEYGLFEFFDMQYGFDLKAWNINTMDILELGGIEMEYSYKLIHSTNSAYITEDFIPSYLREPEVEPLSWWEQNMYWVIGVIITLPLAIIGTWYFNSRANCGNLIDPSQSLACRGRTTKPEQ